MIKNTGVESAIKQLRELLIQTIKKLQNSAIPAIIQAESSLFVSNQNNDSQLLTDGVELFSLLCFVDTLSSYTSTTMVDDSELVGLDSQELVELFRVLKLDTHSPFLEKETVNSLQAIKDAFSFHKTSDGVSFCLLKKKLSPHQLPYFSLTYKRDCLIRVNSLLANDTKGLALLSKLKTNDCFDKELVWNFIKDEFCYELVIKLIEELELSTIAKLLKVRCD